MQPLREKSNIWENLKTSKNLLAFSSGVDSSALFFMLVENDVKFDIAIVDYNLRASSKDEVNYAKELAETYDKKIFLKSVKLTTSNFEKKARDERYDFFTEIIKENGYDTLLTAHHLGDKLEWFFMRFVRGSGAVELNGFSLEEKYENFRIVRPLIYKTKDELLDFLNDKGHKYFIDESNFDEKYERNYFRKHICTGLLDRYKDGIKRSFEALETDKKLLLDDEYEKIKELYFFKRDKNEIRQIAKILKFFKIVLTKAQREECEKNKNCVISGKVAVGKNDTYVFIAPFIKDVTMTKEFKEECRLSKIPLHVRAYMYKNDINAKKLKKL